MMLIMDRALRVTYGTLTVLNYSDQVDAERRAGIIVETKKEKIGYFFNVQKCSSTPNELGRSFFFSEMDIIKRFLLFGYFFGFYVYYKDEPYKVVYDSLGQYPEGTLCKEITKSVYKRRSLFTRIMNSFGIPWKGESNARY